MCPYLLHHQIRRADPNILTALTWRKMFIATTDYCGPSRYKEWWKQLLAPLLDRIWELHLHSWVYDLLGVSVFLSHTAHFSRCVFIHFLRRKEWSTHPGYYLKHYTYKIQAIKYRQRKGDYNPLYYKRRGLAH